MTSPTEPRTFFRDFIPDSTILKGYFIQIKFWAAHTGCIFQEWEDDFESNSHILTASRLKMGKLQNSRVLRRNETNVISAILRYGYIQNLHKNLLLMSLPWSLLVIRFSFNPGLTKIIFTLLRNDTSLCYWNCSVNKWN